jgi:hypothetical protein
MSGRIAGKKVFDWSILFRRLPPEFKGHYNGFRARYEAIRARYGTFKSIPSRGFK